MLTQEKLNYIIDEWIEVKVNNTKQYYESLGYKKYRNKEGKLVFKVHPWELPPGSHLLIRVKCPNCGKIRTNIFRDYIKMKSVLCNSCSSKISGKERKKNLIGKRFNRLVVIEDTGKRTKTQKVIWKCLCDCGKYCEVIGNSLQTGAVQSCGCLKRDNMLNKHREQGHFVLVDHTQKEIDEYFTKKQERRHDIKWNKLSKQIRKYKKECEICNSSTNLLVHHINSYNDFPKQRYDKDNLIVLCAKCHRIFHNKYRATKENWEKWIKEN